MLLGAGGFAANPDGPLAVEFCKRTLILGSTLLANDQIIPANGATIIGVSNFVGGVASLTGGAPDVHWDDDGANALTPASFDYTLQDNVTFQTSTATVTLQPFYPLTLCVDDGPGFKTITEFHTLTIPKFGAASIGLNDTFGGATSPPPNVANPVTLTVLEQNTPAYVTLFDSSAPGISTLVVPPGVNQIEVECWGAEGGRGGFHIPGGPSAVTVAGLGAHRQVTNLSVTPGQILSIAVGGAGVQGTDTLAPPAVGGNIGSGGAAGVGFADNLSFGGRAADDSFGFPDGAGAGMCPGCSGAAGGSGQDAPVDHSEGSGGGGGGGSAVTTGDATTNTGAPLNQLGPVLNVAGGGGGGAGTLTDLTGRTAGQAGGPPNINRFLSSAFFASRGDTGGFGSASAGGTGGGGGGYRGGDSEPTTDLFGFKQGFGGESNDERYDFAGDRAPGNHIPNVVKWPSYSGSTTTEFVSVQVGNGRVRIRGRTIVDQLGGTDFPINCTITQNASDVFVTSDVPFGAGGNECSFFYYLTDTKTGQTSAICEVKVDVVANFIDAVNDSGIGVTELVNNNVSIASLESNDTFDGTPIFALVPGSAVNCTAIIIGANVVVVPVARSTSTTCSFQYTITDPLMPPGFEFLGANRTTDTATVSMNINLPAPVCANFNSPQNLVENIGQGPPSILVSKATLLGLGGTNCGSQPCTFVFVGTGEVRCNVTDAGANVSVVSTSPAAAGNATWLYRVMNAQGVLSGFCTVTHNVVPVPFTIFFDSGGVHTDTGPPFGITQANNNRTAVVVPGGTVAVKSEAWGAAGGDGGDRCDPFPGPTICFGSVLRPDGGFRSVISVGFSGGEQINVACGGQGRDGADNTVGCFFPSSSGGGGTARRTLGAGFFCGPLAQSGSCCGGGSPLVSANPQGGFGQLGNCSPSFTTLRGSGGGGGGGTLVWLNALSPNVMCAAGGGAGSSGAGGGPGGGVGAGCSGSAPNCHPPGCQLATGDGGAGGGGGGFRGGNVGGGGTGGNNAAVATGSNTLSSCSSGVPSGAPSGLGRVRLLFV